MIQIKMTDNLGGFNISGDYNDFDKLYDALTTVIQSDVDTNVTTEIRVLGLCYDLRHANQGDRDFINVDNSVNDYTAPYHDMILPRYNVYSSFNVLYPEIVFILLALNEKLNIYARTVSAKNEFYIFGNKETMWDENIAIVRQLQSQILKALFDNLEDRSIARVKNLMDKKYVRLSNFHHQYIDKMNIEYINMDTETRKKKLPLMFKRFMEPNKDYFALAEDLKRSAQHHKCHASQLRLPDEYPEEINW